MFLVNGRGGMLLGYLGWSDVGGKFLHEEDDVMTLL